jgi:peptidoglycan/LPS O-acetylase OafA/YrhL
MKQESSAKLIPFFENAKVIAALSVSLFHFLKHSDHTGLLIDHPAKWLEKCIEILFATVFIFFAISGYVIPAHLKKNKYSIDQIVPFLVRRMIRIYIPFLVCILAYILLDFVFKFINLETFQLNVNQLLANITLTVNFTHSTFYNPIFWTLAIEVQFYILIAFVYPLLSKLTNQFEFILLGILIAFIGYFFKDVRFVFCYFPMIFSGYFLLLFENKQINFPTVCGIILLQIIVIGFTFSVIVSVIFGLFLAGYFVRFKKVIWPQFALKTYSFYLFHGLLGGTFLYFTARHVHSNVAIISVVFLAVIFSILGSWLTFYLFEKPALRFSKRIFKSK